MLIVLPCVPINLDSYRARLSQLGMHITCPYHWMQVSTHACCMWVPSCCIMLHGMPSNDRSQTWHVANSAWPSNRMQLNHAHAPLPMQQGTRGDTNGLVLRNAKAPPPIKVSCSGMGPDTAGMFGATASPEGASPATAFASGTHMATAGSVPCPHADSMRLRHPDILGGLLWGGTEVVDSARSREHARLVGWLVGWGGWLGRLVGWGGWLVLMPAVWRSHAREEQRLCSGSVQCNVMSI